MGKQWRPSATTRAERDAAVELLVECARLPGADAERARDALSRTTMAALIEGAEYHGVIGLAHVRLRELGAPDAVQDALRVRYEAAVRHHLTIVWELARLVPVLETVGVTWAVVKGPVAAELLYDDPGERSYGDLDVLVDPGRFDVVLQALRQHGARLLDRNWTVLRREMRGEVHVELPRGSLLDLHWNLVNMYRGRMNVAPAEVLSRVVNVELGGVVTPTLDPTDSLIHLALHGTLSGGDRLVWMSDVGRAAAQRPPDWDALVRRAGEWRISVPVGFMLRRAASVLDAPIPDDIPARLLGRRYVAAVQIVDRVSPWQRAGGRLTTASLALTRSMGFGIVGAGQWLARRAIRSLDPREPRASSSFTPRGDERDYEAFVGAIVASNPVSSSSLEPEADPR